MKDAGEYILVAIVAVGLFIPAFLLTTWLVMLSLGALASIFGVPSLAIPFWHAAIVSVIFSFFVGVLGS